MEDKQNHALPLVTAVAMSLYHYNVSPTVRAQKLYDHFKGACAEVSDLENILVNSPGSVATELAMPTAAVYVAHALERYGQEAVERVLTNLDG